jgi:hypothetical protein
MQTSLVATSFQFDVCNFAALDATKGAYFCTPQFSWNERLWALRIFPGGNKKARDGFMSIYLSHRSTGSITGNVEVKILDKFGNTKTKIGQLKRFHLNDWSETVLSDFTKRSDILDKSKNILDSNGSLAVVVSFIKDEPLLKPFIPKNPLVSMIREMFLDRETADVCFEVNNADVEDDRASSVSFHAHRFILRKCAPMLAALFESKSRDVVVTCSIANVKPEIFRHLLWYVYGGRVSQEDLETHAKDIIDAADKYSIVNLKLEAEVAYVESTTVTIDNAMDNLLYADAKNCALLKEAVMDFFLQNGKEVIDKVSFDGVPGNLMKDLLVAMTRKGKEEKEEDVYELNMLRVSELRRRLHESELCVDGSREAMIEALKANAQSGGK